MSAPFSTQFPVLPKALNIDSSQIVNGTIAAADIANGAITRSKLSELTTNLMIFNSHTSTTTLDYTVKVGGDTYFIYPIGPIGIGMAHSLRVCIPNIATQIALELDTDGKTVTNTNVYMGATIVGTYTSSTLTFTLDSAGYDNVQIGIVITSP